MTCNPSAFPEFCLAEATRIAPSRSTASDGICGDARHQAMVSDHNPDSRGIPHAFDVTQDAAHFNAHAYGDVIAHRIQLGLEHRVKYLVSWDYIAKRDKICDPAAGHPYWRLMDTAEHSNHLHNSFLYTVAVEKSTDPYFGTGSLPAPPGPDFEEWPMIAAPNKPDLPNGRVPHAVLDRVNKRILLFNRAALAGDLPAGTHREMRINSTAALSGMCPTRDPKTLKEDNKGVEVGALDGGTFKFFWS